MEAGVRLRLGQEGIAGGLHTLGLLDHEYRQRGGQIVRLNDKTVTLISDGQKWRVPHALLHRVVGRWLRRVVQPYAVVPHVRICAGGGE